jgi:hypothetical protein
MIDRNHESEQVYQPNLYLQIFFSGINTCISADFMLIYLLFSNMIIKYIIKKNQRNKKKKTTTEYRILLHYKYLLRAEIFSPPLVSGALRHTQLLLCK